MVSLASKRATLQRVSPASPDASVRCAYVYTRIACALRERVYRAAILRLFTQCRPATIVRFVIAIGVDAVKRVALWARPHISQESSKATAPSVAHGDATSTVMTPMLLASVCASTFRGRPRHVLTALAASRAASMNRIAGGGHVALQTPATLRLPTSKHVPIDGLDGATVTTALPSSRAMPRVSSCNNRPSPERPSSKIYEYRHNKASVSRTGYMGFEESTMKRLIALCVFLAVPTLALAQPVTNPSTVAFTPSADHALLSSYEMGYFAVGASAPTQAVSKTLASLTPSGGDFTFPFPRLLFGTFEVKLRACAASTCSAWVLADRQAAVLPLAPGVTRIVP